MQSFEIDKTDLQRIKIALDRDDAELQAVLKEYHASEIAILFEKLPQEAKERIINILPADIASEVISEMDEEHHPGELLINLDPEKRSEIVEELDYDDATDIISQLEEHEQQEILEDIDQEDATSIRALLNYDENTAGGLMNSSLIKVNIKLDKKGALEEIIRQSEEMEEFYTIYVVDDSDTLKGIVSIKNIIKAHADVKIKNLLKADPVFVKADLDQEEVAKLISQYNLTAIPVVDDDMKLLGRITVDDIIDVMGARLQRNINSGLPQYFCMISICFNYPVNGIYLGMRLTIFFMVSFAYYFILVYYNGTHHGVRAYVTHTQYCQLKAAAHIYFVLMHTTKVAFMLLCYVKTINEVFLAFRHDLNDLYNNNETEALTLWVVSEIMELSKAAIKAFPEKELTVLQQELTSSILMELKTGKPLQYILGYAEFYGLRFVVNPATLIPRPETEELVEWILKTVGNEALSILDIGTGSGCIPITLKKNLPNANISAVDISPEALETAKINAQLNEVEINFIEADILNNPKITTPKLQLIVSNPPYVTPADKAQMHINVVNFEPHNALFVPQDDPLLFYKAIADFSLVNLTPGGWLFLEINESYGHETVDLLNSKGFTNIELKKDMSGRDRMIKAVL